MCVQLWYHHTFVVTTCPVVSVLDTNISHNASTTTHPLGTYITLQCSVGMYFGTINSRETSAHCEEMTGDVTQGQWNITLGSLMCAGEELQHFWGHCYK